MNNSETPTGANGKKELKVNKTNDADKLLENYFQDLEKEGYGKINLRALVFDVPEVAIKAKGGDENEEHSGLSDVINVISSGQYTVEMNELINGTKTSMRLADLKKVKAKTKQLKQQKQAKKEIEQKKSTGGTEKPAEKDR